MPLLQTDMLDECAPSQEGVPAGYEAVSLIEALNGPSLPNYAMNMQGALPTDITLQSLSSAVQGLAYLDWYSFYGIR